MGVVCSSEEGQLRIINLQTSLQKQSQRNMALKKQLEAERERYRIEKKELEDITSEKLEQLGNEKKQTFKSMLKEKKRKTKFEDEVEEYKKRIKSIEDSINTLTFEKDEKAKKEKEQKEKEKREREKKEKEEAERQRKRAESEAQDEFETVMSTALTMRISNTFHTLHQFIGHSVSETDDPLPFRVKDSESENDSEHSDADESDSDDSKNAVIETRETIHVLGSGFDVKSEVTHVHSWLYKPPVDPNKKEDVKQLKHRMASLLTDRSEKYREQLVIAYYKQYGKLLGAEMKKIMVKGNALHIINALLMTRAQYDAVLISEYISEWDIEPVADIICCRNRTQLKELHAAFKVKCKGNVKKKLQALAQKEKKKTLMKVIGGMFDFKRKEKVEVDLNRVNKDTNFILTTKSFKNVNKEKLVLIFCANSVQYIKMLNDQFLLKSKDSLTTFIDKKLGPKSTVGYFCKIRIKYALDAPEYYAKLIRKLGGHFKKNQTKISDVFVQRIEIDLDLIRRRWNMKKFGDGKSLKEWVIAKCGKGSTSGIFLSKMLDKCPRYVTRPKSGKWAQMMT